MYVRIEEHESLEKALRRFKKRVQRAGILSDYKRKNYFESKSERRRRKSEASRKRRRKSRN